MAHGSQTLKASTCPSWCVSTHRDETTFHMQADDVVRDIYGKCVEVSAYWDEKAAHVGVYVGDREFRIDQLAALKAAIESAERVALSVRA